MLNEKLTPIKEVIALLEALTLWYKIEQFLKISEVRKEEVEAFLSRINQFESNIKLFYKTRVNTFLTKVEPSDDETYYLYTVQYYIPCSVR